MSATSKGKSTPKAGPPKPGKVHVMKPKRPAMPLLRRYASGGGRGR
jgi:hypothetical protein